MRLGCFWIRRQIDAYLDGTLPEREARRLVHHLDGCARCAESARQLRRVAALVREGAAVPGEPEWTDFWPGIRACLLDAAAAGVRPARSAGSLWLRAWIPRLALGSAVAGALLAGLVLWQNEGPRELPTPGVAVQALEVASPNTGVMVFSPPEQEMTVIWVFGLDPLADQSRRQAVEVTDV